MEQQKQLVMAGLCMDSASKTKDGLSKLSNDVSMCESAAYMVLKEHVAA